MESTTTTHRTDSGEPGLRRVADEATGAASAAAGTAKQEAAHLADSAKAQVTSLVSDAQDELRTKADEGTRRASGRLRELGDQIDALANGHPEQAGQLCGYLGEGRERMMSLASRLDERGVQGVIDDVSSFGRRKPGTFLVAAAGVGFLVGRLARAGALQSSSGPASTSAARSSATTSAFPAAPTPGATSGPPLTQAGAGALPGTSTLTSGPGTTVPR